LAVADAYDAMRSDRAYRKALTRERAASELQTGTGSQFCPLCVGALLCALNGHGDFSEKDRPSAQENGLEEDFLALHPASRTVRVDALLN
jgi:HD-GYP domain-containing protein (c-di-GMP phosphodiesterase class II)